MRILHPSRAISGHDYNRETADVRLVARTLLVRGELDEFRLDLEIPAYIADKLGSHNWDQIGQHLDAFAREKEPAARLMGVPKDAVAVLLFTAARRAIYDAFTDAQIRAGNDAWAVPVGSMFADQYPGAAHV